VPLATDTDSTHRAQQTHSGRRALAQFKAWVPAGDVRYFVVGSQAGDGPAGGSDGTSWQITSWVEQTYSATMLDGYTVYDLTSTPRRPDAASHRATPAGAACPSKRQKRALSDLP
jgi:hypothetical protein